MKLIQIILLTTLFVVSFARDKYTTKYDGVDLDEIIKNRRLLKNYVDCLLGRGNCTPDGEELKRVLPDALHTKCTKCNQKQKDGAKKILKHLFDHEPRWYSKLEKKYDSYGQYRKKYESEIRN